LRDGRTVSRFTRFPAGTRENPLDDARVNAKARELMAPVLGAGRADAVIERVNALERLDSVRRLSSCFGDHKTRRTVLPQRNKDHKASSL
jgi:hypothetical protein